MAPGASTDGDEFGPRGRPNYGSSFRVVAKKMAIDANVDPAELTRENFDQATSPLINTYSKRIRSNPGAGRDRRWRLCQAAEVVGEPGQEDPRVRRRLHLGIAGGG